MPRSRAVEWREWSAVEHTGFGVKKRTLEGLGGLLSFPDGRLRDEGAVRRTGQEELRKIMCVSYL